jgi:tellurite resistance protein TerC
MGSESSGTPAMWVAFAVQVVVSLFVDLGVHRRHAQMGLWAAAAWARGWVLLAVVFGIAVSPALGAEGTIAYLTAYILEKSLSVDNLFVFIVIFTLFRIPPSTAATGAVLGNPWARRSCAHCSSFWA